MKTSDLLQVNLTTTSEPVKTGRLASYYPALLSPPGGGYKTLADLQEAYPKHMLVEPEDRNGNPPGELYDVVNEDQEVVARYRWTLGGGWLQELKMQWSVSGDYVTALAVQDLEDFPHKARMNVSEAMRLGVALTAYLMDGEASHTYRARVLDLLNAIVEGGYADDYVKVTGDGVVILTL